MYENAFGVCGFDLEQFIVKPEQQEGDFDSTYFISWKYSHMVFFTVLI